jgi:hypothetical protein
MTQNRFIQHNDSHKPVNSHLAALVLKSHAFNINCEKVPPKDEENGITSASLISLSMAYEAESKARGWR